jgi:hypothetical protein
MKMVTAGETTIQKTTMVDMLAASFSENQENTDLVIAADKVFGEWDNEDDRVYDAL